MIDSSIDDLAKKFPPEYRAPTPVHIRDWIQAGRPFGVPFYLVRDTADLDLSPENMDEQVQFNTTTVVSAAAYAAKELMQKDGAYIYPYTPMNYSAGSMYQIRPGVFIQVVTHGFSTKLSVTVYMMKYIQPKLEEV